MVYGGYFPMDLELLMVNTKILIKGQGSTIIKFVGDSISIIRESYNNSLLKSYSFIYLRSIVDRIFLYKLRLK